MQSCKSKAAVSSLGSRVQLFPSPFQWLGSDCWWWIFVVMLLFFNFFGFFVINNTDNSDFWEHLASINSFRNNIFSPISSYSLSRVGIESMTHLFTPFHFIWGVVSNVTRIHPYWLMPVAGTVNLAFFFIAVRMMAAYLLGDKAWRLPLACTLLFFWFGSWGWSGFLQFGLLPVTACYPYRFALPFALITLVQFGKSCELRQFSLTRIVTQLLLSTILVFLVHPLTGAMLAVVLSLQAWFLCPTTASKRFFLAIIPFGGLIFSLVWPFFPIFMAVVQTGAMNFGGDVSSMTNKLWIRCLPVWPGMFYTMICLKRLEPNLITIGAIGCGLVCAIGVVIDSGALVRFVAFSILFLQLGVIALLRISILNGNKKLPLALFSLALLVFAGREISFSAKTYFRDFVLRDSANVGGSSDFTFFQKWISFSSLLTPKEVLLARPDQSWKISAITGCHIVAVQHNNPFMANFSQRQLDVITFFSSETNDAQRLSILSKYQVSRVVLPIDWAGVRSHSSIALLGLKQIGEIGDMRLYSVRQN